MNIRNNFTAFFIIFMLAGCQSASRLAPTEMLGSTAASTLVIISSPVLPTATTFVCVDATALAIAWEDRNGNGVRQKDEPSLAGVKIKMDDQSVGETSVDGIWSNDHPMFGGCGSEADINTQVANQCAGVRMAAKTPNGYRATTETTMDSCDAKFGFMKVQQ